MKISKRSLLIVFSLMLALTTAALGTVAYMTDQDTVTNTFTVGNINIIVDEKDWDNSQTGIGSEPGRDKANSYTLVPGLEQIKDPRVTVLQGSESCYVRMRVTMNCYAALETIAQKYGKATDVASLLGLFVKVDAANWECKKSNIDVVKDTMTIEYWYKTEADGVSAKVDAAAAEQELPALFSTFTVPIYFIQEDLNAIKNLVMDVDGDAVQTEAFDSVEEAWNAFNNQFGLTSVMTVESEANQGDETGNTDDVTTDNADTTGTGEGNESTDETEQNDGGELTGA